MEMTELNCRILLVEDSEDDADLIEIELRRSGLQFEALRVDNERDFIAALDTQPELVICDYTLPQFSALRALLLLQDRQPQTPLIMVSRRVGEDVAVEAMRRGAADYLLKDRLARLPEAVRRVRECRALEREKQHMRELLALRQRAVDSSSNAILIAEVKAAETPVSYVNPAFCLMTGLVPEEVLGGSLAQLLAHSNDAVIVERLARTVTERGEGRLTLHYRRRDGSGVWNDVQLSPVRSGGGEVTHLLAILTDITEARGYQEQLERASNYDALTGLPNRNLLQDRLEQALLRGRRGGGPVGLIALDLDRFKLVNDSYGHALGDRVLVHVAEVLRARLAEGDTLARTAGDEFCAVISQVEDECAFATLIEDWRQALAEPFAVGDATVMVTASIGAALYPRDAGDAESLRRNADLASYRAKTMGGNQWRFFTRDLNLHLREQLELQSQLHHAVSHQEFHLFFQPLVDIASRRIVGAEALLRWAHPSRGLLLPGEFIHLAEQTGLVLPIGEWVLEQACERLQRWAQAGHGGLRLAINASARQFRQPQFARTLKQTLLRHSIDPARLDIEISEAVAHHDHETLAALDELRQTGVLLTLDDFGVGSTSISSLMRLPIDRIKIDRSLINGLPEVREDAAIVSSVVRIGRDLGFGLTATGVERPEQLEFLRALGCHEAQGFLLGRPLPPAQFERLLASRETLPA